MQLCVSGTGVFKLYRYSEGALKQTSFAKVKSINFLCHAWMSEERLIAGTDTGRLLVFESGDLRREINVSASQYDRSDTGSYKFYVFSQLVYAYQVPIRAFPPACLLLGTGYIFGGCTALRS